MMNTNEFHEIILQFEFSSFNYYGYEEFKNRLVSAEEWAFENSELLAKTDKYNVKDIYRQLYEFEKCIEIKILETITKTREEAIIFSLLQYAEQDRPIIAATFTERNAHFVSHSPNYNPETERIKSIQRRKVNALECLLAFYIQNLKANEECYNALHRAFIDYMSNVIRLNKYEEYNIFEINKLDKLPNRYDSGYVIRVLKILISHNDLAIANKIFETYPVIPHNKKETADYDRIKIKLNKT